MSITIRGRDDYRTAEFLGLEAKDRAPNDYLRFTARVFNSFKPLDPTITTSSYISGFETTIQKVSVDGADNLEFYIRKGSGFVDDQFIAFKDDIIYHVPTSKIVNNVDYYLVLQYQYSNQCLYNPAVFDYIAVSAFDESTMLSIIKFKMDGYNLIVYPQNLDDKFIDNYSRLFKLVSDKARNLFKINAFQGVDIRESELYVNATNTDYSTKSGDVVFLDLDGLYKPARSCNRKIDKAMGIYIYNPKNGSHTIVTNGLIEFNSDDVDIDLSNKILQNMEPGKSYYLLDNCSETNYAWENGQQPVPGKLSSRFIPGNVMVGYAVTNSKFMVDFQLADELNTANFLELFGLPEDFQNRFNLIFEYWKDSNTKDFRNAFVTLIQQEKEDIAQQKDTNNTDATNKLADVNTKLGKYNNTTLAHEPAVTVGSVTGPIDSNTIKTTITEQSKIISKYQAEQQFKKAKVKYLVDYLPTFKADLTSKISATSTLISNLTTIKSNFCTKGANNVYFKDPYKIPGFSDTTTSTTVFSIPSLNSLKHVVNDSNGSFNYTKVASVAKHAGGTKNTHTSTSASYSKHKSGTDTTHVNNGKSKTSVSGFSSTYSTTNEIISSTDEIGNFKSNLQTYIDIVTNIKSNLTNVKSMINDLVNALSSYDTTKLTHFLDENGTYGASIKYQKIKIYSYLFGTTGNALADTGATLYGEASYLKTIGYFIDKTDNNVDFNNFTQYLRFDNYSMYYIINYLVDAIQSVLDYLSTLSATSSEDSSARSKISNTTKVYDNTRKNYLSSKYTAYTDYSEVLKDYDKLLLDISDEGSVIDSYNDRISTENTLITNLTSDMTNMDHQIIDRVSNQQSVNSLVYISEYERKIYNYTYLTIRIRLKQTLIKSIRDDVNTATDIVTQLRAQTIPDRSLIDRAQANLDAFTAVLNNITLELNGMITEYNALREEFGIDDPVTITDDTFNDYGLSDPNLSCFKNLNTFSTF